jgi:hypothetical protein
VATITPGYEIGDLGSQRRAARADVDGSLTYLQQTPRGGLRRWQVGANLRREWNYDGDHILTAFGSDGFFQRPNYTSLSYSLGAQPRSFDDRLTRGGPVAIRPATGFLFLEVASDARKPLVGQLGVFYQGDAAGGYDVNASLSLQLKSSPRWNLTLSPAWDRQEAAAQYVGSVADPTADALYGRRYLFTRLKQTSLALDARFNYTFTPDLSLQVYAAPFLSAVDFGSETRYLAQARSFRFATDTLSGVHPTDFNLRSLRGNAVLRWEWRQGSTLFLAWSQSREDFAEQVGNFDFARDRAALFRAQPDNVFLIKVNYWLNP